VGPQGGLSLWEPLGRCFRPGSLAILRQHRRIVCAIKALFQSGRFCPLARLTVLTVLWDRFSPMASILIVHPTAASAPSASAARDEDVVKYFPSNEILLRL
jgi:hypothetical protein